MKGSHRIIVESRKVKYDFVIHRNITIITGDSGSGKSTLIKLIMKELEPTSGTIIVNGHNLAACAIEKSRCTEEILE